MEKQEALTQKREEATELAKPAHIHTAFILVRRVLPPGYDAFKDS